MEVRGGDVAREGLHSPLAIPLKLTGNFGELRTDHFHAGLDFKTMETEGHRVLAAHDGVVARVVVSPVGYGQAVYLRSPDGITTVYGHLKEFAEPLASWIHDRQYADATFSLDVRPDVEFTFRAGEILGLSGNSGSSAGPHLHFEFRVGGTHQDPLLIAKSSEAVSLDGASRPRFDEVVQRVRAKLALADSLTAPVVAAR
jgi:murein DD-endopeptidase MepM/ murein hydrolase activator NlpD